MWLNNDLIPLEEVRVLHLSHGYYVRIAVPPGSRRVNHIATRCLASAYLQGLPLSEILDRHALHAAGWHATIVDPPTVPLDAFSLVQLPLMRMHWGGQAMDPPLCLLLARCTTTTGMEVFSRSRCSTWSNSSTRTHSHASAPHCY